MKKGNTTFQDARNRKDDEFYTTYESIDSEMRHYKSHFAGKTVYCNCDDPYKSNFARYFLKNFNTLGIKRLIITSFKDSKQSLEHNTLDKTKGRILDIPNIKEGTREISDEYIDYWLHNEAQVTNLNGDGDFRSKECLALLDESDIIVTNPPFSLMRELVSALEEHKKQYLLIGTENALTYKEIFPLIQQNKLWTGYKSGNMPFRVPEDSKERSNRYWVDDDGQKWRSLGNTIWLTNLDTPKRHNTIELTKTYNPEYYPKYDNYDAINVDRVENIPKDYPGIMGVPVTILTKLNTDQFELIGEANHGKDNDYDMFKPTINGKELFKKILIKNKSLMENEKINREVTKPEKVSFDNKEDLKAYITDYCEKHGWNSDLNHIDVSKITDMSGLFAKSKFNGDISKWNVSSAIDMSFMFSRSQFNQPLDNWDTSSVKDMSYMFDTSKFNQPLDNWNTEKVIDMSGMFMESPFNQSLDKWDVSNVKDMSYMFKLSSFNQPIDKWNTSKVEDMSRMFAGNKALEKMPDWKLSPSVVLEDIFKGTKFEGQEESLKRITPEKVSFDNKEDLRTYITDYCNKHGWDSDLNFIDVSKMTDMSGLFMFTKFNGDVSKWDVSKVEDMAYMFSRSQFNGDISNWDVSKVTNMSGMFKLSYFNQPIGNWNTGNVENMSFMFYLTPFNQPLDNWNTSKVESMAYIFYYTPFNQPLNNWDVSNVRDMTEMFIGTPFNQPLDKWNTSKVEYMEFMFSDTPFNQPLNIWDVSKVKNMSGMFANTPFNQPLDNWDTGNVTKMDEMFKNSKFNQPLDKWNTSRVENMNSMFADSPFNHSLENWDVSNVTDMISMFAATPFNKDVSSWKISPQADTLDMFKKSDYSYPLPTSSDKSLTSKTDTAMEKDEKNTVQATEQSTKNPIILPPAQLLDRALETAMSGNGKWLNHKSIHSPQIYGYTGKDVQNTLSGLQQVLLALNTQENQYRTNIYATPKEIKAYNLRLDGTDAQKGITLSSPDGTAKEYFNADQIDKATIKDAYTNVQLSRADKFKPLNFAEMDDITRNKELLEKDPSSIVIFNKGSKYYLYEESALRLQDVSDIKTQKHPNTGIVYSFFHPEDIEKYIRAISNSGHRVVIANSASNFKGINIRKIENLAIRNIQKLAANEGFSIGKVTCMPSNYMPASDMVSLNVTGKERSTIHTLREIGDIYHSGFEALYSDKRLAGMQKLPMGVRESRKFSQLAMEVATGIQMLRQGLPAVISEGNIPLIPNWQQQLRENPKAMALLEQHVEALTTAYERSMRGLKVDYDQLIPGDKNIQKPQEMRPEKETISRSLGEYTNYGEKKFVVIRDKSEKAAIVIFPVGASTLADTETPGFNKELIDNALRKENINQVYFMTPDTFESLNKTNDYFANTAISVEKMHYGKLSEVGKINVKDEIKRTELPEIAAMIPYTNAKKKIELYIQSTAGEEVTIPLTDKNDIKKLAKTIKQEDRGAANTTRMAIAQKYFVMAQKNPDLVTDYLHPNLPQEVYDRIDKTRVICDENKDYFINANIDGKELPYKQMNIFDISIFRASSNKESFMEGIVTRTFANELGLKADNKEEVDSKVSAGQQEYKPENQQQQEPEDNNENEQTEEREVRRGFHR